MDSPKCPPAFSPKKIDSRTISVVFVTTNLPLTRILADDLSEVHGIEAAVLESDTPEFPSPRTARDDIVVVVTEGAIASWIEFRHSRTDWLANLTVIGAIGTEFLEFRSPRTVGFDGVVDLRRPALDIACDLRALSSKASELLLERIESVKAFVPASKPLCLDELDRRILGYLTMGLSDREIGAKVFLSSQTVRNRVSKMLERAHLSNRTQLAMACIKVPALLRSQRVEGRETPRKAS